MTDVLVQRELVDRREDPDDRRARVLQLTPKGKELLASMGEDRVATILSSVGDVPSSLSSHVLETMIRVASRSEKKR
jgi:DNA-binding MarR family transcriptional regulator